MEALVIAAGKPKNEKSENCVYAKLETLALDGTNPEAGDEVEMTVTGKVANIENGVAKIELEKANGEPLETKNEEKTEEKEPSMEEEYQSMKEEAEKEDYGR